MPLIFPKINGDDTQPLKTLLGTYQAPDVVSGGGPLGAISQAKLGASAASPTAPQLPDSPFQTSDNLAVPSVLGTVSAPSRASLLSTSADNDVQAAQDKLAADTPKAYDYKQHGVLGNVGHVLGRIGNIAGDFLDPEATLLIPHSDLYNAHRLAGDSADVQQKTENAQAAGKELDSVNNEQGTRDFDQRKYDETAPDRAAQTQLTQAEAQAKLNPIPTTPFGVFLKANPNATPEQAAAFISKPIDAATAAGLNKETGTNLFQVGMPMADATTLAAAHQHNVANGQAQTKIVIQQDKAATAGTAQRDRNTEKEYTTTAASWNKRADAVDKQSQAAQAALADIQSGNIGQAMGVIKLLSATASGQGSGVRITQTELSSLAHANGIQGDISAFINRASGNGPMSDQEKRQALAFAQAVVQHTQGKIDKFNTGLDDLQGAQSTADVRKIDSRMRHELLGEGGSNNSSGPAAPQPGDVHQGADGNYRFKGGDQYDKNNWEKVGK